MIEDSFNQNQIDFVLLEGFDHSLGVSPENMIRWAKDQEATRAYLGFEAAFSIVQASKRNIPFRGGEPEQLQIFSQVLQHGYKPMDLVFYQFLQQVFQHQEADSKEPVQAEDFFQEFKRKQYAVIEWSSSLNFADFKNWYYENMGRSFSPGGIEAEELAPYENGKALTQRLSSSVNRARDQFVLTKIDEAIEHCNSVLVVFGGSHWSMQKKALEAAFGPPHFERSW